MERLNFRLPDFTRYLWVSPRAQEVWENRIQDIVKAWNEVELLTVVHGVRPCALRIFNAREMATVPYQMARYGLSVVPVQLVGHSTAPYRSLPSEVRVGEACDFFCVVARSDQAVQFKEAWDSRDDEQIGELLGFPACCREFFTRAWVKERLVDTTWSMAQKSCDLSDEVISCEVSGPYQANILLRWLGVRSVPHLPCSFACEATVDLALHFAEVGTGAGFAYEFEMIHEMLSWPVEWTALHGIAEIKTPIMKISTVTDATAVKYTVRRPGNRYPSEGARGISFPYQVNEPLSITSSRSFRAGLRNPISSPQSALNPDHYFRDNGFNSIDAMKECHRPLLDLSTQVLRANPGSVLDLGCGNGALLAEICKRVEGIVPYGVEIEAHRLARDRVVLSNYLENLFPGDICEPVPLWFNGRQHSLILIMIGVLIEAEESRRAALLKNIQTHSKYVLYYAYPDYVRKYEDIEKTATEVGIRLDHTSNQFHVEESLLPDQLFLRLLGSEM